MLFGTTFVVVQDAVEDVGPVPFLAVRFLIGAALLGLLALARRRPSEPGLWWGGALAGGALLVGYLFQTIGLQYTTASVSAFVTYLLVVMVPILSAVALRRPPTAPTVVAVAVATGGLLLLTGKGVRLGRGELLTLGCALSFAVHVVVLADLAPKFDTVRFTAVQLLVVGGGCAVPGLFLGGYGFTARAWIAAGYTAAAVSALAFGLQVWGQRRVGPTRTALLLMVEPVSAAVLGYVLGERLGWVRGAGAALILVGIAIAELPVVRRRTPPPVS